MVLDPDPPGAAGGQNEDSELCRDVEAPGALLHRRQVHCPVPAEAFLPEALRDLVLEPHLKPAGGLDVAAVDVRPATFGIGAPSPLERLAESEDDLFASVADATPAGALGVLVADMAGSVKEAGLEAQTAGPGCGKLWTVVAVSADAVERETNL